jgi:hypothetical protein
MTTPTRSDAPPAPPDAAAPTDGRVVIGDGRILLPRAVCERWLAGVASVALIQRDGQAWLLPLAGPVAGGLLLKQRNRAGDCVVHATDFLAERGFGRFSAERDFAVRWVADAAALLIVGLVASTPVGHAAH